MVDPRNIKIQDFSYNLPDDRIAKYPVAKRDESKLLVYNNGMISHDVFKNITSYLQPGSLLVYNNTKVIQARLHFHKTTGALIEVFLLEPFSPCDYEQIFQTRCECTWVCMIGNLKKWKNEPLQRTVKVGDQEIVLTVEKGAEEATGHLCKFTWNMKQSETLIQGSACLSTYGAQESSETHISFSEILEAMGELPIPPYLNRETEASDLKTYQTVYSKIKGSVAAPTAGLHFTEDVLADIDAHGIERDAVTLHVGAGTFKPVKSLRISGHEMHREYISVKRNTIERIIAHGGKVTAVGTTSVRTLESLYYIGLKLLRNPYLEESQLAINNQWEPYERFSTGNVIDIPSPSEQVEPVVALQAILDWMTRNDVTILNSSTKIIIAPGYTYHIVERLITNFHQPQSTLLLLVSALIGENWHRVYRYALDNDFRFLSYGDSSLLIP